MAELDERIPIASDLHRVRVEHVEQDTAIAAIVIA